MDGPTAAAQEEDWKALCASLEAQLAEANADIQDYTESSKELQDELEKELARMEKSEREMRRGLEQARGETDDWKAKYTTALRDHTTTITHMQKELESLRSSEKSLRTKLRDMELDNDDLEKSEREKDSSLQDLENRYGKSIERIALLEEELVTKAQLEEEVQRLKDELRDLEEEIAVMRTQAATFPPTYPQPLTPPGTLSHPSSQQSTTPPPSSIEPQSPFTTPRKQAQSPIQPPSIELVKATPRPSSTFASTPTRIGSPPAVPPVPTTSRAPVSAQAAPLSRSVKAVNLASAATTPKAVRERRADGMIKEMKDMTHRVKELTSRLDSRRNLVMAGSSIPRASMSPQSGGMTRSVTARRLATSSLGQSQLAKSVRPRPPSRAADLEASCSQTTSAASTRPPSRSNLRMSMGGGGRTGIPVRPPSRLSTLSASTVSTFPGPPSATSSRPTTPFSRSPTPSAAMAARPPWGSNFPPTNGAHHLGLSTRRRTSSVASPVPPLPTAGKPGLGSRRPASTDSGALLGASVAPSAPNGRDGLGRRASLALGRSVLRRPSGAHAG